MATTRLTRHIRAPHALVYRALLDAGATQRWRVPDGMTITLTLADADGGTLLSGVHENLPPGVSPTDNELGLSMSLSKLARLVEADVAR